MSGITHKRAMELLAQAQIYFPAVVPDLSKGGFLVFSAMKVLGHGATIDAALDNARASGLLQTLPPFPPFRNRGNEVELRGDVVATAKSSTYAKRIANALNLYHPNERGK